VGTTTAIVAIVLGSITFLSTVGKLLIAGYRWGRRVEKALDYIESEMRHNGGSTIRDHVVRTNHNIETISGRLDRLEATHGQPPAQP
jgi:hypothetical protein